MEETAIKRTDKIKKKTFGNFYAEVGRWNVNGKGSKDLKIIITDLKNCITHQLVRIKKLKFVIECYKKADVTKKLLIEKKRLAETRNKKEKLEGRLKSREGRIERQEDEIDKLTEELKLQEREIAKLNRELDRKEEKIDEVRSRKARGYTRTVKVPLSSAARRLEKIADSGVNEKMVNNLEYVTRTAIFLKKNSISIDNLALLTRCEIMGNVKSRDLGSSYKVLGQLTEQGYLTISNELKGSTKYWFLSLKGKQLIKDYKNYLSYSKSVLTR